MSDLSDVTRAAKELRHIAERYDVLHDMTRKQDASPEFIALVAAIGNHSLSKLAQLGATMESYFSIPTARPADTEEK